MPRTPAPTPLGLDGRLLFLTRAARMFSYGFLSVVLVLYLAGLGFSEGRIGLLLTLTLVGDTLISLWISSSSSTRSTLSEARAGPVPEARGGFPVPGTASQAGKRTFTQVPRPGSLWISISPWWAFTVR